MNNVRIQNAIKKAEDAKVMLGKENASVVLGVYENTAIAIGMMAQHCVLELKTKNMIETFDKDIRCLKNRDYFPIDWIGSNYSLIIKKDA